MFAAMPYYCFAFAFEVGGLWDAALYAFRAR